MKNQILLLGHTGFIATHIFEALRANGNKVRGFDREDIDLLLPSSTIRLTKLLASKDILIITAAINRELGDNLETMQDNIKMISNVGRALENQQVKKCVYLSTADVYGRPDHLPITEQTPVTPKTYYAIAKYCCESLLEETCRKASISLLILRYNGVFGPGQRNIGYGPNAFIRSILEERVVRLWGKGQELRDTLYVKDLARIICRLSLGKESGIYNIAKGKSLSFAKMVKMLQKVSPKKFNIIHRKRTGPSFNQVFNITKLKSALPKFPFTTMEQALRETYQDKATSIE